MKQTVKTFYSIVLSVVIGTASVVLTDIFVGLVIATAIGLLTEITFSEIENKKGLTCDNK